MAVIAENLQEEVPRFLQSEAMRLLQEREVNVDGLAKMLDIFPDGARRLLGPNAWPAETSFRVLNALGVSVNIFVEETTK